LPPLPIWVGGFLFEKLIIELKTGVKMGKRRRKLLRRKYASLPWNVYNKLHPKDNSEVIEEMKKEKTETLDASIFSTPLSEISDPGDWLGEATSEVFEIIEEKATELVENFIEEKPKIPPDKELRGMRKSQLLSLAKELEIDHIRANNTKKQILLAIQGLR
jgi:hypothetical protein